MLDRSDSLPTPPATPPDPRILNHFLHVFFLDPDVTSEAMLIAYFLHWKVMRPVLPDLICWWPHLSNDVRHSIAGEMWPTDKEGARSELATSSWLVTWVTNRPPGLPTLPSSLHDNAAR